MNPFSRTPFRLPSSPKRRRARALGASTCAVLLLFLGLAACGYGSRSVDRSGPPSEPRAAVGSAKSLADKAKPLSAPRVRIGYFANVTHASALVGLREGFFARRLGRTTIGTQVFGAGPSEIEALDAGAIDIGWIGPSPAINGYARSHGRSLRIVAGSTSGGASLVVNPRRIPSTKALAGKRIASPQLGNTQDVALLHYLESRGLRVDARTGRGAVTVIRQDNKEIPTSFRRGDLDGAWVPEPTAAKLVAAGGRVLIDERSLWKGGRFVVTNVIVAQPFLARHPDVAAAVLRGLVDTNAWIAAHPDRAKADIDAELTRLTGKPLPRAVLDKAFGNIDVTVDPLASTLREEARHAVSAGLLDPPDLRGIYDLRLLNKALRASGKPPVGDAGLGVR